MSVAIITRDEEANLPRCLESLKPPRGGRLRLKEIVVVDSGSRDRTRQIARHAGARLFTRPWRGYGPQKNFALSRCRGDWVLSLDADESVTPELWRELERVLPQAEPQTAAFFVPRRNFFLGRWIRHAWWPDFQLRVLRRGAGRFTRNPVHEGLQVDGAAARLAAPLDHRTYGSVSQYVHKMNRYTDLEVLQASKRKEKFAAYYLTLDPLRAFFNVYVAHRGFRDGWHGFLVAALTAFYRFATAAKMWEARR